MKFLVSDVFDQKLNGHVQGSAEGIRALEGRLDEVSLVKNRFVGTCYISGSAQGPKVWTVL